MKLTLNCDWGGWSVPGPLEERFDYIDLWGNPELRYNEEIIKWVEENPSESSLQVFDLPDEATDYKIINYDGQEDVVYCMWGALYWLRGYFDA